MDLHGPPEDQLDPVLRQPKRLALLAYLAAASPRGFHRRDTLLGLFWPELDQQHAQNALAQAVHVLRRSLGPDVVVNRGPAELGLGATQFWCDAWAFEQALDTGRAADALELYRGDLLRGLFLSETLDFERWLEGERARLRERASGAAWGLSQDEERTGNPGAAVYWARRAQSLSPDDESTVCRLVSLLERVGDRAGALRAYDQFAARLASEYESDPSPQTQALIEAIRRRVAPAPGAPPARAAASGALERATHNFPADLTPLIGRERELARLRRTLLREDVRLLTLSGPGGIGKTRLAVGLATELLEHFADGAYFVALDSLGDRAQVAPTLARALGVREAVGQTLMDSLKAALQRRAALLVLDNFERVLGASPVVAGLLAASPLLKVLVTSREPLHLKEEQAFPVAPLALPPHGQVLPFELLSSYAALELFIERAHAVLPDFVLTETNAAAVAEICTRLEGLPLALELAAARVRGLPPQAILARLGGSLQLLRRPARDLPPRLQSLRRTIAWSYDLLDASEKTLFQRLSVFVGSFRLEAAERVCDPTAGLDVTVREGVESLVSKNLLRGGVQSPDGEARFGMLDTIREYALELLAESHELETLRRSHAEYYLALAEKADLELKGPDLEAWLQRFEAEHANFLAVLAWSKESGELDLGLRLVSMLFRSWRLRGLPSEGRAWLEELLARATSS